MARSTSIHIGVNHPRSARGRPLTQSEECALKMAELAHQAGYGASHLLRGADATHAAVRDLLSAAARALEPGHTLFVTFSGHGSRVPDRNRDERDRFDETWCLHDRDLLDDDLVEIWKLAAPGTRVLVVSESCFGGGMTRGDEEAGPPPRGSRPAYRSAHPAMRGVEQYARPGGSCISGEPAREGIRASLLMMTASAEAQRAREGLYTGHLLTLWSGGAFRDSFCAMHARLCASVQNENPEQAPQILMLGTPDPQFPLEAAFHLRHPRESGGVPDAPVMRGGAPGRPVTRGGGSR